MKPNGKALIAAIFILSLSCLLAYFQIFSSDIVAALFFSITGYYFGTVQIIRKGE